MHDDGYASKECQKECDNTPLTDVGFDFGNAGTITAFPAFQQVMGKPYAGQASGYLISASIQSAWNGVATAGDILGVMASGQVLDRIGRKHSILFGVVFTAVGIGMQYASQEWKLYLGGRLVNCQFTFFYPLPLYH